MLKKFALAGLAVTLALGFMFGSDGLSYLYTTASQVKDGVKESVPVQFEIERARKMIASLGPEIRKNMHLIAKEEVEVDRIVRQIERLDGRLEKEKIEMSRLNNDLQSSQDNFVYASRRYSRGQVQMDLVNRLQRAKTKAATMENLTKVLHARQQGLTAARQKLEEMLSSKQTLIVEVENLEARHKMSQVAQAACDFHVDNSHLSRVKECVDQLESRVAANEKFLSVEGDYHDEIPIEIDTQEDSNIEEQVATFLRSLAGSTTESVAATSVELN